MITVNRVGDRITGMVNGQPFSRKHSEEAYAFMKQLEEAASKVETIEEMQKVVAEFMPYTRESYKTIIETNCPNIFVNSAHNTFHLKVGDKISSQALPEAFAKKVIQSVEKGIDVVPLLKCFARFMRKIPGRPHYTVQRAEEFAQYIAALYTDDARVKELMETEGLSEAVAIEHSTGTQVAITQEGLLVCFKVARELLKKHVLNEDEEVVQRNRYGAEVDPDTGLITYNLPDHVEDRTFEPAVMGQSGDKFYCESKGTKTLGHIVKVGCTHYLENWNQVSVPGSRGLHCGGLSYIKGFQQTETVTHNIFVDPADIHTVRLNQDGVMTVKRYFVHSSFAGPNRGIYHSSTYAAINDAEYKLLLEAAIDELNAKHENALAELV